MTPDIVSRDAVGLLPARSGVEPLPLDHVDEIVDHHTDEPPPQSPHSGHDEAHDAAAGQWRSIQAFHMNERGFADIAYHFGIAPDGAIYEGRSIFSRGAHSLHCNGRSIGVAFMMVDVLTDAAKTAFLELRDWLGDLHYDVAEVEPHSHCDATSCPGDTARAWISDGCPPPEGHPVPRPTPRPTRCADLPPGPPPNGLPLLREGSAGGVVRLVQQRLAELGHPPAHSRRADGSWDGLYGPSTAAEVRELQMSRQLVPDGIVGRQTWCALGVV